MSLHEAARWIVTYDITEPKRGVRVHRLLKKRGIPLQYSVFLVEASSAQMHALMRELETLIAKQADDVRAYRLPANPQFDQLGPSMLPDDMLFTAHPAPTIRILHRRPKELT